jgi:hypothetical protein
MQKRQTLGEVVGEAGDVRDGDEHDLAARLERAGA